MEEKDLDLHSIFDIDTAKTTRNMTFDDMSFLPAPDSTFLFEEETEDNTRSTELENASTEKLTSSNAFTVPERYFPTGLDSSHLGEAIRPTSTLSGQLDNRSQALMPLQKSTEVSGTTDNVGASFTGISDAHLFSFDTQTKTSEQSPTSTLDPCENAIQASFD
eukprot:IDg8682t1